MGHRYALSLIVLYKNTVGSGNEKLQCDTILHRVRLRQMQTIAHPLILKPYFRLTWYLLAAF